MTSKTMIRAWQDSYACLEDGDVEACPGLAAVRYAAGLLRYVAHGDAPHYVDDKLLRAQSRFQMADAAHDDWHRQCLAVAEQ